jgi:hypothetical protein
VRRVLWILLVAAVVATAGGLLKFAKPITIALDRIHTRVLETRRVTEGYIENREFEVGGLRLDFETLDFARADVKGALFPSSRVALLSGGKRFFLGPGAKSIALGGFDHFTFTPDQGDTIRLTVERSFFAWPTPFEFSPMGAPSTSHRSVYSRLEWKKLSGAIFRGRWTNEQGYNKAYGWSPPNQYGNFLVNCEITEPAALLDAAVDYVRDIKHWQRGDYHLQELGPNADATNEIIAVIHREDENAAAPGAGRSVQLLVNYKTRRVVRESGWQ